MTILMKSSESLYTQRRMTPWSSIAHSIWFQKILGCMAILEQYAHSRYGMISSNMQGRRYKDLLLLINFLWISHFSVWVSWVSRWRQISSLSDSHSPSTIVLQERQRSSYLWVHMRRWVSKTQYEMLMSSSLWWLQVRMSRSLYIRAYLHLSDEQYGSICRLYEWSGQRNLL